MEPGPSPRPSSTGKACLVCGSRKGPIVEWEFDIPVSGQAYCLRHLLLHPRMAWTLLMLALLSTFGLGLYSLVAHQS